ncbi:MAG: DUF4347 domain-containing protein [Desulfomonile tiedjei]|nr:DUF4347 domain-containing protein [Desulfomonile tiedjei]
MRLLHRNRAHVYGPRLIFEQLEERIVLDASVDSAVHEHPFGWADSHHDVVQVAVKAPVGGAGVENSVHAAPAAAASDRHLNVVLISDQLPELATFKQAAGEHAKVILYDEAHDDLKSINASLHQLVESSGKKIDNLAVLSHAAKDQVWLGTDKLNLISAASHRSDFEGLGKELAPNAQIQFYGCDTAADSLGHALVDRVALYTQADVFASAAKTGGPQHDWTLEYSSNPSVVMEQILDPATLQTVTTELYPPSITLAAVPPVHRPPDLIGPAVVNLGGAIRVSDSPAEELTVTITPDQQPLINNAITGLSFSQVVSNVTVTAVDSGLVMVGLPEGINEILSTLTATISSEAPAGIATIRVTAVETASGGTADATFYIDVDRAPYTPQIQVPNFQTVTSGVLTTIPFPASSEPHLRVTDTDSHDVGVIIQAFHGTVSVPSTPGVVQYATNIPFGPSIVGPVIGLRGDLPSLWSALHGLEYRSFPGYFGPDTITVNVNDLSYIPLRQPGLSATEPISIRVLPA